MTYDTAKIHNRWTAQDFTNIANYTNCVKSMSLWIR